MVDAAPNADRTGSVSAASPATVAPYRIERTGPDVLRRHDISDEELTSLADTKRDYLWEGKWVALGVLLGSLQACINALWGAYGRDPGIPLTPGDLFQVLVFFMALIACAILWLVMKKKTTDASDLAKSIRERTAQEL